MPPVMTAFVGEVHILEHNEVVEIAIYNNQFCKGSESFQHGINASN